MRFFLLIIFIGLFPSYATEKEKEKTSSEEQESTEIKKPKKLSVEIPKFKVDLFGFIKADYVHSNRAMLSFGRENLAAPNMAKRIVQNDDRDPVNVVNIRETLVGFTPRYGKNLSATLQFSFLDLNRGNGGLATSPAISQAFIEYQTEKFVFFAGQKWDIFSPLYPDTYNIFSGLLGSGNLGLFREQIGMKHILSQFLEFTYSLGNSGLNTGPNVLPTVEQSKGSTLAFQLKYKPIENLHLYLSGIYANLKYSDPNYNSMYINRDYTGIPLLDNKRIYQESKGISFSIQYDISKNLVWKGETHVGQNMDNLSLLSLGSAQINYMGQSILQSGSPVAYAETNVKPIKRELKPIREFGIWSSITYKWKEDIELGFLLGTAEILNKENLKTSFTKNADNSFQLREMNLNQSNVNIWTSDELGGVYKNSTIGGSIAKILEANWKIFLYYQYTETRYVTTERQSFPGKHIERITESGEIIWKQNLNSYVHDSGNSPHTHLVRIGAILSF